jgi:hypothetical protein
MKLKGFHFADVADIQGAVTDELKKVQKGKFSATFHKLYDRAKACIYDNGGYFELKKVCVFLVCLRFKNKISSKTFGPHFVRQYLKYSFGSFWVLKFCTNCEVPRQSSCNFLQIF